jgi:cullin 1
MYLHPSTNKRLISTVENVLISEHTEQIQEAFLPLLERDRIEDLTRMFKLLARVPPSLDRLRVYFEEHVKKQGLLAIQTLAESAQDTGTPAETPAGEEEEESKSKRQRPKGDMDPKTYMEALLQVHKKFSDLCQTAFDGEPGFVAALDKACREFVNRNAVCKAATSKSPELLAKYCDSLLRKSSKLAEDGEIDTLLNSVVHLLIR